MNWTIEYKRKKGEKKEIQRYEEVKILKSWGFNEGMVCYIPAKETKNDTGIRKLAYEGIVNQMLTH